MRPALRQKLIRLIMATYLFGAGAISIQYFIAHGSDGASLLMILWTLPIALIGLVIIYWPLGVVFPFMPAVLGQYGGHFAYFVPAVFIMALTLYKVIGIKRS
jgi:hypothetical protein